MKILCLSASLAFWALGGGFREGLRLPGTGYVRHAQTWVVWKVAQERISSLKVQEIWWCWSLGVWGFFNRVASLVCWVVG